MAKRRISVRSKAPILSYVEVSPSKTIRKRSLPLISPATGSFARSSHSSTKHTSHSTTQISLEDEVEIFGGDIECTGPVQSAYIKRQERSADHWSSVRDRLLEACVEFGMLPSESLCALCDERANISCSECGPLVRYCEDCTESVHSRSNIFHRPLVWKVKNLVLHC